MKNQMTKKEFECLTALILLHYQKVSDYTKAVPNVGMARRHKEWVEMLLKAQTLLRGETITCDGCIREKTERLEQKKCVGCLRLCSDDYSTNGLTDNFKRREN